jgi:hypothetical protein
MKPTAQTYLHLSHFVRRGFAHLLVTGLMHLSVKQGNRCYFLLIVEHHLFNHAPVLVSIPMCSSAKHRHSPCLAIKVAQLAVLWLNLGGVDLWMMGEHVLPPLLLIQFLEVDKDRFLVLCVDD